MQKDSQTLTKVSIHRTFLAMKTYLVIENKLPPLIKPHEKPVLKKLSSRSSTSMMWQMKWKKSMKRFPSGE